jgi:hypothetical protein
VHRTANTYCCAPARIGALSIVTRGKEKKKKKKKSDKVYFIWG